jgi:hypothetical protein
VVHARADQDRPRRLPSGLAEAIAQAAIGAILTNINVHLANGSPHPWLIPRDGFDEGVDMDSLLPLIQLAFVVVSTKLIVMLRRERAAGRDSHEAAPARPASLTG